MINPERGDDRHYRFQRPEPNELCPNGHAVTVMGETVDLRVVGYCLGCDKYYKWFNGWYEYILPEPRPRVLIEADIPPIELTLKTRWRIIWWSLNRYATWKSIYYAVRFAMTGKRSWQK